MRRVLTFINVLPSLLVCNSKTNQYCAGALCQPIAILYVEFCIIPFPQLLFFSVKDTPTSLNCYLLSITADRTLRGRYLVVHDMVFLLLQASPSRDLAPQQYRPLGLQDRPAMVYHRVPQDHLGLQGQLAHQDQDPWVLLDLQVTIP